ncbi:hypothetical protein GCM10027089_18740 [Nocardia thraciensis]
MLEEVHTLFRTEGLAAASARFLAAIGGTMKAAPETSQLPPRTAEMWSRRAANHAANSPTAPIAAIAERLGTAAHRVPRGAQWNAYRRSRIRGAVERGAGAGCCAFGNTPAAQ